MLQFFILDLIAANLLVHDFQNFQRQNTIIFIHTIDFGDNYNKIPRIITIDTFEIALFMSP